MPEHRFPGDFLWGVATSSYQIEGAVDVDGRGPSIWDTFSATPGKVVNGESGARACEHYLRFREDVALMKSMGVKAYRFSIAWPRVLPTGREQVPNARGLDFYSALVDELLEAGIEPMVTLYHWDLPQPLQDDGGWPSRGIVPRFVHFADVVSRRLGDRVSRWITHNEPWVVSFLGYQNGEHAPGHTSWEEMLAAAHHILLSHGRAVPVIRGNAPGAEVGITLNLCPAEPASRSRADADATRHFDGFFNRWFLDPLYGRGYPSDMLRDYTALGRLPTGGPPWLEDGDLEAIATPTDFLGVNYYSRGIIRSESVPEAENAPRTLFAEPEPTDMGWEVHAPSLERLLRRLDADYPVRGLFITENGAAYDTPPDGEGRVRDLRRQRYLREHLLACHRAIEAGVPLRGYFAWSLFDNFEWAFGYAKRFGLVWVDFETQARIVKDSGLWYGRVMGMGGLD